MRLWSIHPKYLDRLGLLALWRESLLARKVLKGKTKGYKNHPQLIRFKKSPNPISFINAFIFEVWKEAKRRGYFFDKNKLEKFNLRNKKIKVTSGQVNFEFSHLLKKLYKRDRKKYIYLISFKGKRIEVNPVFSRIKGKTENWEIIN